MLQPSEFRTRRPWAAEEAGAQGQVEAACAGLLRRMEAATSDHPWVVLWRWEAERVLASATGRPATRPGDDPPLPCLDDEVEPAVAQQAATRRRACTTRWFKRQAPRPEAAPEPEAAGPEATLRRVADLVDALDRLGPLVPALQAALAATDALATADGTAHPRFDGWRRDLDRVKRDLREARGLGSFTADAVAKAGSGILTRLGALSALHAALVDAGSLLDRAFARLDALAAKPASRHPRLAAWLAELERERARRDARVDPWSPTPEAIRASAEDEVRRLEERLGGLHHRLSTASARLDEALDEVRRRKAGKVASHPAFRAWQSDLEAAEAAVAAPSDRDDPSGDRALKAWARTEARLRQLAAEYDALAEDLHGSLQKKLGSLAERGRALKDDLEDRSRGLSTGRVLRLAGAEAIGGSRLLSAFLLVVSVLLGLLVAMAYGRRAWSGPVESLDEIRWPFWAILAGATVVTAVLAAIPVAVRAVLDWRAQTQHLRGRAREWIGDVEGLDRKARGIAADASALDGLRADLQGLAR